MALCVIAKRLFPLLNASFTDGTLLLAPLATTTEALILIGT